MKVGEPRRINTLTLCTGLESTGVCARFDKGTPERQNESQYAKGGGGPRQL